MARPIAGYELTAGSGRVVRSTDESKVVTGWRSCRLGEAVSNESRKKKECVGWRSLLCLLNSACTIWKSDLKYIRMAFDSLGGWESE